MKSQLLIKKAVNPCEDRLDSFDIRSGEIVCLAPNGRGTALSHSDILPARNGFLTTFPLLPVVTTATALTEKFLVGVGTGTEVIGRSTYGGVLLTTGTSIADTSGLVGVTLTASRTLINSTTLVRFGCKLQMASIAAVLVSAGVTSTIADADVNPTANAGDGAQFLFDPSAVITTGLDADTLGNWICHAKIAGADTYIDSGVPVAAATPATLEIQFNSSLEPLYYINGTLVATGAAMTTGITPYAAVGVYTAAASAKTLDVHSVSLSRENA